MPDLPSPVLVVIGHPRGTASLCGALASAYAEGAREAGADVEILDLSTLAFDPDVRLADPADQAPEPDLERARAMVLRARHLVFAYPNWWGTMPARLKGFLDRLLVPGFAFRRTTAGTGYEGLLAGRTAELLVTMDTPGLVYRLLQGAPGHKAMARSTLGLCGIRTVRIARFGVVESADGAARERFLARAHSLGAALGEGAGGRSAALRGRTATWLQALRLQFYPMSFLAYLLGASLATGEGGLAWATILLGYLVLFAMEAATVFTNDVFDRGSDVGNRHWSPFTGGSRVLADGALTTRGLLAGTGVALAVSLLALVALLAAVSQPLAVGVAFVVTAVLALGYTVPPLKLSHRTLGELDVAATHAFGVVLFGWLVAGGAPSSGTPWLVAAPLALAVLPSITLSGVPDVAADRAAGKLTIPARFGLKAAFAFAGATSILAIAAAAILAARTELPGFATLTVVALVHAIFLLRALVAQWPGDDDPRRIDALMAWSLSYVIWFVVVPLVAGEGGCLEGGQHAEVAVLGCTCHNRRHEGFPELEICRCVPASYLLKSP